MGCAIVTGGSRGIGKETAVCLAKQGYDVVITYVSKEEAAKDTVSRIQEENVKGIAIKADAGNEEDASKVIKQAVETFGSVDVLVNNAGITKDGLLMRMKKEDFAKVLETNLTGAFNMTKEAAKFMTRAKKGRIINLSSVVGEIGNAGQCNYAASKAGIIGLTKSAAKELASRNITVNAVAPGFIETDMTSVLPDGVREQMLKNIPLGTFGKAQDVANLICFLASDKAAYITGQVINVCGGMVM